LKHVVVLTSADPSGVDGVRHEVVGPFDSVDAAYRHFIDREDTDLGSRHEVAPLYTPDEWRAVEDAREREIERPDG